MVVLNLFPGGVLQLLRRAGERLLARATAAFLDQPVIKVLEWLRLPADLTFILVGVVPMLIATAWTWLHARKPVLSQTRRAGSV